MTQAATGSQASRARTAGSSVSSRTRAVGERSTGPVRSADGDDGRAGRRALVDGRTREAYGFLDQGLDDLRLGHGLDQDRKSTRLNSSHANISYAVFCLEKK